MGRSVRLVAIGASAVVVVAVVVLLVVLVTQSGPGAGTAPQDPTGGVAEAAGAAPAPVLTERAAPATDPVLSAQRWLETSLAVSASDPEPTSWIDRVAPVVTGPLAEQYRRTPEDATRGVGWAEFVRRGCFTTVVDAGGNIPPEAPRDTDVVYVQITGQQITRCGDDVPDRPAPPQPVAATVEVRLDDDQNVWRVARQVA